MTKTLTEKTLSGLNWNFLNNYSNAVISTLVGIVLSRLLTPSDFGLLGMVLIFTGLADLFVTLGMGQSVIRIKDLTENHIRVATTLTILSSILIYLLFYFSAGLIADFYHEQKLISIIKVLSSLFIIRGVGTVSYGLLQKELDFKAIMIISIFVSLAYGILSLILALMGLGVWSLVYGNIASSLTGCFMILRKFPVNLKPLFKRKEFRELASFGTGVSLSNILFYASSKSDFLIVGKMISSNALGLYNRAFNLMSESINKVTGGIYNVLFPAFASSQNDKQKLRMAYLRTIKTVSYIMMPLLAVMIVNAEYLIKGLYGAKWAEAIPVFRILAFAGILRITLAYSGAIAHATGRVYVEAFQQVVYFIILTGSALYMVKYGIEGVAVSVVTASIWMFIAQSYLAIKIIESTWKEFLAAMFPGIANLIVLVPINLGFLFIIKNYFSNVAYEFNLAFLV
ncbi:MAG TPA: lipopolysaccharide biosynthesis protein, partial [Ignavibacteriaceae bacterium]|nr:lipopolysaccharide biosynthesis protein [Ignavibacteriaceae bacterium]